MSNSEDLRESVARRAKNRCEYCLTPAFFGIVMELDHIVPVSAGGTDDLHNLCLCCTRCNRSKFAAQMATDPLTDEMVYLFNPREDNWDDHFEWLAEGVYLRGKTAIGRATVSRLKMNRAEILAARRVWVSVGWHPPQD